jgi:hypothetical protein
MKGSMCIAGSVRRIDAFLLSHLRLARGRYQSRASSVPTPVEINAAVYAWGG